MELALKIVSWIAIILGALAVFAGLADAASDPEYMFSVVGGGLFLGQGILSLSYMKKYPSKK